MVGSPVNRFAWAFNDPAFSDVQLVLRAANTDADARGVFCASNIPCDCNRQTNASGYNQRDVSDHPARRACTKAFTPDAKKSEINKVPISGSATVTAPAALRGGKWIPLGQTNTEVRIYAHSIILASCSEMMRSWLSRWSEEHPDPDTDSLSDAQTSRHGAERRRRLVLRLDMELAPNELAAGEAVIRFMYTQALDGVEDDEELLACMLLADRWLLPDCVAACAARLQSTPAGSLSWRVRAALLALPLGLSAASPHVAQLQARAEASLMRTFRCPELILDDPDNRRLLLSLPPDRLEQLLLSRQDVQVTSENVVLALLSAWLQHNCHPIIQCNTNRTCSVGKYSSCDSGRCGSCCARGDPSNAAFSAASAAAANIATGQGRGLCGLSGDAATATRQRSCDCSECGNRRYGQEPRGDSGGGRRGAGGWDWGGGGLEGAVGAAGSPELEALLRLVRYRDLTPHYRSTVAPFLPGLRVLRLHHVLLAEASAAADAVTATGAADASSLPRREEPPSSVLRGVVPCGDAIIPDTSSDYESTPMTVVPATSQPLIQPPLPHNHYCHHHHQQQQVEVLAHPEPRPQHIGTTCKTSMSCTGSQESGDATAVAVAAAGRRDTGSTHSSFVKAAAAEASQVIGLCHNGSGSGGDGGTTSMEEHRSMMGNNNGRANSTSSLCTGPGTGVRTALETTALSNPQTATGLVSGAATAAAPLPFPSAMNSLPRDLVMTPDAAVHRSVPSLPRRLPYNMFRLIEWTRDIRDVRLHLTAPLPRRCGRPAAGRRGNLRSAAQSPRLPGRVLLAYRHALRACKRSSSSGNRCCLSSSFPRRHLCCRSFQRLLPFFLIGAAAAAAGSDLHFPGRVLGGILRLWRLTGSAEREYGRYDAAVVGHGGGRMGRRRRRKL
ncbi:hypothetical protein Vretimale_14254 [Volvox reticuliferus]|uniref:BTB domain-containing protein n=1 Tax=Volvox reticuliferus TaxID=1737510 RepID=A0A8J4GP90_9CHLO|nr:hypothetical protein Vretimale_14254 [Volvox reticuliferus]